MNRDYSRFKMEFTEIIADLTSEMNIQTPVLEEETLFFGITDDKCMTLDIEEFFAKWFHDENISVSDVANEAVNVVKDVIEPYQAVDLNDFSTVKDHLRIKVVLDHDAEEHSDEMCVNLPNAEGITISAEIVIRDSYCGECSAIVKDELLESWGIDEKELFNVAIQNTLENNDVLFISAKEYVNAFDDAAASGIREGVYMAVTSSGQDAVSLLANDMFFINATKHMSDRYYIMPSSKDEVLLIPERMGPAEKLDRILRAVCNDKVSRSEHVSNFTYHYDAKTEAFEVAKNYDHRIRTKKGREER